MVTIAEEWLNSCSGCEIALLNMGEPLLDLLPQLEFVHMPVLLDNKYYGPLGREKRLRIPKATVGIASGGVRNSEHLEVLHTLREQVDILIALGTCAANGGVPALANFNGTEAVLDFVYHQAPSLAERGPQAPEPQPTTPLLPSPSGLPCLLTDCTPLSEHVRVDLVIPGCPPHPDWIAEGITALLEGRPACLPYRSVCSLCPAARTNTGYKEQDRPTAVRRMLDQPVYDPEKALTAMQCLLEQGFMCLGPITLAGCGGRKGAPKCIAARTPCRGCQGPVPNMALPFVDYLAALTAAGIDAASMPDKKGYLSRFNTSARILEQLREPVDACQGVLK